MIFSAFSAKEFSDFVVYSLQPRNNCVVSCFWLA